MERPPALAAVGLGVAYSLTVNDQGDPQRVIASSTERVDAWDDEGSSKHEADTAPGVARSRVANMKSEPSFQLVRSTARFQRNHASRIAENSTLAGSPFTDPPQSGGEDSSYQQWPSLRRSEQIRQTQVGWSAAVDVALCPYGSATNDPAPFTWADEPPSGPARGW